MRRTTAMVFCSVLLSSCLELEETIAITADGSGTQKVAMTMPDGTLADVRRASAVNRTGIADPQALFTKATVEKELQDVGMKLLAHKSERRDTSHTVDLTAGFASPFELRKSPLTGSAAEWTFTPGPVPNTIEVTLWPQGKKAWDEARAKAEAMKQSGGEVDAVAAEFFARRKEQLAGLDVRLRLQVPGKILRYTRNLEQTGDREVVGHITAAKIATPEDLVRAVAPRYQLVFDAGDCPTFPLDR